MRKVLVSFEVSIAQSSEHPLIVASPDYIFSREFDKDDDKSFSELCDLEFQVVTLAKSFKALGCQVSVLRKELYHLNL